MNWYIGQEIVCIKTHSQGAAIEGVVYVIKTLRSSDCSCKKTIIDIGTHANIAVNYNHPVTCDSCNGVSCQASNTHWLSSKLFAPLESLDISDLEEILLEEPFKI